MATRPPPNRITNSKMDKWKISVYSFKPVRNGLVINVADYVYSSAGAYLDQKGILETELIELDNTFGFIDSWWWILKPVQL